MTAGLTQAAGRIARASSLAILTGAGISAESGIPTFRGAGGLWRERRAEDLASPLGFARDPDLVWTWYNERRAAHAHAEPNAGHRALADLVELVPHVTTITQNVDSLHLRAGSPGVLELHGHLREARCDRCGLRRPLDATGLPLAEIAHACGGRLRPDIVWFGEAFPQAILLRAIGAAESADVMLVVGTSGLVHPAASLATVHAAQAYRIEVNPDRTAITPYVDVHLAGTAVAVLPALVAAVRELETGVPRLGSQGTS